MKFKYDTRTLYKSDFRTLEEYEQAMKEQGKNNSECIHTYVTCGIAIILLMIFLFGSIRTVGAGEVGIITRFGEVTRTADSGLALKIPLIERMTTMVTRTQKEEVESSAVSKDLQDVKASLALNYSIDKETALKLYKELGVNYKDNVIIPVLQESFKSGTAEYTAEGLITHRSEAKTKILEKIQDRLKGYGIVVSDLNIVNLDFSKAFNEAIEQKAVAQQKVETAKQDLERTKIEAERKIEEAKGEAEAQRLQQSTLTDNMIKKMWIERWNGTLPTTMTGDNGLIMEMGK